MGHKENKMYKQATPISSAKNITLEQAQSREAENLRHKTIVANAWYKTDKGSHKVTKHEFQTKLNRLSSGKK